MKEASRRTRVRSGADRGCAVNDLIERLEERVLRSMIDRATVSFWILDEDERIRYVNPAGASLTGYAIHELLGRPFSMLMDDEQATRHAARVKRYAERGGPSTILGQVREFQLRHRSGEMIDIELKAFPLDANDGERRLFGGLISDNRDRKTLESQLRRRATQDPLTGCLNREGFFPQAEQALEQARAQQRPVGLLLLDIDHFKRVNDRYGHQAGDRVLERFAAELKAQLGDDDLLGRYGGEEFVVLLPDIVPGRVLETAERLRQRIETLELVVDGRTVNTTISVGCAVLEDGDDIDLLVARADRALYRAKRAGRNRVAGSGARMDRRTG